MKDLTTGSVTRHLLHMSAFLAMSMVVQTLYLLADLYWVGHLGKEAIAAVGVAGNLMMIVLALTQMLGVGTTTLMSHAAGRKDQPHAEAVFNQSFVMSIVIAFGAALRATGIIKPAVGFQVLSVFLNIVLAPLLIFGIGPWPKLGVTGAALATFISILIADVLMIIYFEKKYHYVRFRFPLFRPQTKIWKRMLGIGVPAGTEFLLLFVYIVLVYVIIRGFGPEAQAGFGIGARLMQALFLPVVALSFAVAPVVGQNFGGRRADRVRHSVYSAIGIASLMMVVLTLIAFLAPATLIRIFSRDPRVIAFGSEYLRIVSLNFISAGIVFTTSSVFQGIGNTLPPLFSSLTRLMLFAVPALFVSRMPGFEIREVWYLSVGSIVLQMCVNLFLLRHELRKRLRFDEPENFIPASATAS